MNKEIKELDFSYAYDIEKAAEEENQMDGLLEVYRIVEQALIKFGLRETARKFKKVVIS